MRFRSPLIQHLKEKPFILNTCSMLLTCRIWHPTGPTLKLNERPQGTQAMTAITRFSHAMRPRQE
jgi:hypothetical protein